MARKTEYQAQVDNNIRELLLKVSDLSKTIPLMVESGHAGSAFADSVELRRILERLEKQLAAKIIPSSL